MKLKMKVVKIFNIDNEKKLALVNTLIFALIAAVLYFALPSVLNYPPNSTDNNFQIEIVGITYTTQFVIIISILLVLLYIALRPQTKEYHLSYHLVQFQKLFY